MFRHLMVIGALAFVFGVPVSVYGNEGSPLTPKDIRLAEKAVYLDDGLKNESFAFWSSLGTTLLGTGIGIGITASDAPITGMVIAGIGLGVGPGVGHFYAGNIRYGVLASTGRSALVAGGFASVLGGAMYSDLGREKGSKTLWTVGIVALGGAAVWAGIDVITSRRAVRKANRAHRHHLSISPAVFRGERRNRFGVSISAHF